MNFKSSEAVLLNSPTYRLEVRHLYIAGSNFEIGEKIGELAQARHSIQKKAPDNPLLLECQQEYLRRNYPIHLERMRGVAKAYGELLSDYLYDFSDFGKPLDTYGCSAVYFPPALTKNNHGIMYRNLDFETDVSGENSLDAVENAFKRPYFLELHPDNGFASLTFMSFEIFGLALEGINSEGLAVIHLADRQTSESPFYQPTNKPDVGLNEFLPVQLLLDTCSNTEDAKRALCINRHYYRNVPVHLLVVDRFGNSFVWEYSSVRNCYHIIDGKKQPQFITNFLLHNFTELRKQSEISAEMQDPWDRFHSMSETISSATPPFSKELMRKTIENVMIDASTDTMQNEQNVRTIATMEYDINERKITADFFITDKKDELTGVDTSVRSKKIEVQLTNMY